MTDPARWSLEPEGRPVAAEVVLRATRRPRPPSTDDLARLGTVVSQIPRRSALVARRWSRFATAAAAAIVVAALGTTVWALRGRQVESTAAAPLPVTSTSLEPAQRSAAAAVAALDEAPPVEAAAPETPVRHRGGAASGSGRHAPAVAATIRTDVATEVDGLNREIALIDDARADVKPAPARALDALNRHRREFPRGQLAAEREFLAVEALSRLNRSDEARRRADALRIEYPSSSYAARAARLLPPTP